MKNLFFNTTLLCIFLMLSISPGPIFAQNGFCNNVQKCNDKNFRASEHNDDHAGEFYNSLGSNATAVVYSQYTGGIPANFDWQMRAYEGVSQPGDWYGVGARFLADFCAIEAFGTSDGTNQFADVGFGPDYYGIRCSADGGGVFSFNYGILSTASGSDSLASSYAVLAATDPSDPGTAYAGFFVGDVEVTGTFTNPSDAMLKTGTKELQNSLTLINQLRPKSYQYKTEEYNFMNLPEGLQYGFIAQELETIFPHLIKENVFAASSGRYASYVDNDRVNYKGINYAGLIPIMVDAINEQSAIIDEKDEQIDALQAQLANLAERLERIESQLQIESPNNLNKAFIRQNQPNPTNGHTMIQYFLPDEVKTAQVKIFDMSGKELHTLRLAQRGNNELELDLRRFGTGTFMYTLIVDGQTIETKKMIVQ